MLFLTLGLACISASNVQSADYIDELKACVKVADRDARFDCYENLGKRVLEDESAGKELSAEMKAEPEAAAVPAATGTATVEVALPDDVGGQSFEDPSQSTEKQYSGLLTSCKQDANDNWYFYFDNGQVWKQVDSRRLRNRKCNSTVTIAKGALGYKMQIDADKNIIRVSRVR